MYIYIYIYVGLIFFVEFEESNSATLRTVQTNASNILSSFIMPGQYTSPHVIHVMYSL